MKKRMFLAVFVAFLGFLIIQPDRCIAQSEKELKKDITSKATKEARKEAKQFEKEGYKVNPGSLPMEKQLEKAWMKQYEEDEDGYPSYFISDGQSVGETQSAAKLQAIEMAKMNLAGQIESRVAGLIENSVGNKQLNNEEAVSVTQTIAASKTFIAQELGRVITLFEIYRPVKKNVEVWVKIAYNTESAVESGKKAIREQLEEQTKLAHEKIDALMDF
jgi:GTP cyclohydrolase II